MEFCDQSWSSTNLPLSCTKFVLFLSPLRNTKSGREIVMENEEMVMEKSWKNILSSLWEP